MDALGVEPVRRLVEYEDLRVAKEGAGQAEPLAHSQRKFPHPPVRRFAQPDQVKDLVHPGPAFAANCASTRKWLRAVRPG